MDKNTLIMCALLAGLVVVIAIVVMNNRKKQQEEAKLPQPYRIEAFDIRAFLAKDAPLKPEKEEYPDQKKDYNDMMSARQYLTEMEKMFKQGRWNINKNDTEVYFRMFNGTSTAVDKMVIRFDVTRNGQVISSCEATETGIEIRDEAVFTTKYFINQNQLEKLGESLGKLVNSAPSYKIVLNQNPYTLELRRTHPMYENKYIRGLAGLSPVEKAVSEDERSYDKLIIEFNSKLDSLPEELKQVGVTIRDNLNRLNKYCKEHTEEAEGFRTFTFKYLPTITGAVTSYILVNRNTSSEEQLGEAGNDLKHTLEIFAKSTNNYVKKLMEDVTVTSSVDQGVLEQQLIRDGLYNPYED